MEKFKLNWVIIAVVLILLGGIAYIWIIKSKSETVSTKDLHAKDVALLGREHVEVGTKVGYNSNPPTSGSHHEVWTKSGVYDKPTDDGYLVHSLEHGYVIISYNCEMEASMVIGTKVGTKSAERDKKECLAFVKELKDFVDSDSWKMILIPRPSLDMNFALTAWGKIDKFNTKDASLERVKAFKEAFRSRGPEQTME